MSLSRGTSAKPSAKVAGIQQCMSKEFNIPIVMTAEEADMVSLPQRTGERNRLLTELLKKLGIEQGALLINEATDRNLMLAARNLAKVTVVPASDVNTYQVLRYRQIVVSKAALEKLEQRMKNLGRRTA